jgi:hypothetical protein
MGAKEEELMGRKKKPMFLSKQYRHQRALAKEGKGAKFGSYTYTATDLNEKGASFLSVLNKMANSRGPTKDPPILTSSIR